MLNIVPKGAIVVSIVGAIVSPLLMRMLIIKNMANNTMYMVQELHSR